MLFCPDCGSIMTPKEEGKKTKLVCSCGYSQTEKDQLLLQENLKKVKKTEILEEKQLEQALPQTKETCPKCKNKSAFYWTLQTRAGDEAETRFFECTKCRHRWREYS